MGDAAVVRLGAFGFAASVVPVERVRPNPRQPRRIFDREQLQRLADSIDLCGLLSPPLVREVDEGYELVAGERRWRACLLLGWSSMPVLVRDAVGDLEAFAAAVAENVARDDLNPVDEAHALAALLDEFAITQEQLGKRVGRSQESISNTIRLLNLPDQVLVLLERGELTRAHGKVLLAEDDHHERIALARRAVAGRWTVRRLQAEIESAPAVSAARRGLPIDMLAAADRWTEALRTRVGREMTVRATAGGFQIDVGDQHAVRALLTQLGVPAEDVDF